MTVLAHHGIQAIMCPIPGGCRSFAITQPCETVLSLHLADLTGRVKVHTVIVLPAFAVDVFYLNTRSRSARRGPAGTACLLQADSVPHLPLQAKGEVPVPSIIPIAQIRWDFSYPIFHSSTSGRALQLHQGLQAASITLLRQWQTHAVDPERNGVCRITYSFTIACEFLQLLIVLCCL